MSDALWKQKDIQYCIFGQGNLQKESNPDLKTATDLDSKNMPFTSDSAVT